MEQHSCNANLQSVLYILGTKGLGQPVGGHSVRSYFLKYQITFLWIVDGPLTKCIPAGNLKRNSLFI